MEEFTFAPEEDIYNNYVILIIEIILFLKGDEND